MGIYIARGRKARRAYGFDEVAIVPGDITIDPMDVSAETSIGDVKLQIPFLASAMDAVVNPQTAAKMSSLGGLAVLNLNGIYTRYKDPKEALERIIKSTDDDATSVLQDVYSKDIEPNLISEVITKMKSKAPNAVAVSSIPQTAETFAPIAREAGVDVFVVQATVTTLSYKSKSHTQLNFSKLIKEIRVPVIVGNCVTFKAAYDLMETGISGILVGVGPGAACTTRGVLGLGVPQVTSTADVSAARDLYFKKSGRYVSVITDGGMRVGGDVCKAFVSGADAVMLGSPFARANDAPGKGYHWGMAMPHRYLPRGTRVFVGTGGPLEEILMGPATHDDGSENLVGAVKTCMGCVGAMNIRDFQLADLIIAPSIQTEGKLLQKAQHIGMGK